jgi:nitroimidazol reductase NimA-like FMN-containing flavoprotein (pyridoxamine 5'-phosphate oxidase superfamily)
MLIQSMTLQASLDLLRRSKFVRLACAHEGQPYVIPMVCAYAANSLYSFSTLGRKIEWMRANPLVCVEADEFLNRQDWATVIVLGRYEELPKTPEHEAERERAHVLLQNERPAWWEPAYVKSIIEGKERPLDTLYFCIRIEQISGHRGMPDERNAA